MDLSDGPNLIGDNVIKTLNATMITDQPSMTISDKVFQLGGALFNNFIRDNILWIILLICFVLFLSYRYYRKQAKTEQYDDVIKTQGRGPHQSYNDYTVYDELVSEAPVNAVNYMPITNVSLGSDPENRYSYNRYTPPYDRFEQSPMVNPYGFPTDFNTTTGKFIDYATALNNAHECTVAPPYAV